MHRTAGGAVAGVLFVLPGFVALMGLSIVYAMFGYVGAVAAVFSGLKSAALVMVLQAVMRIVKRSLKNPNMIGLAAAAFLALFVFKVPFPLVIVAAGRIGFIGGRLENRAFLAGGGHGAQAADELIDADNALRAETPSRAKPDPDWALRISAIILFLWLAPALVVGQVCGWHSVFANIAVFFSKMAVVTFGGAYAVLAYVAQEAPTTYGWLKPGEMLDGLGMAETIPGPLNIVNQFVGFMAAFRTPGSMPPLLTGALGGMLTTWITFTPCFRWIFLGAPFAEALRGAKVLNAALVLAAAALTIFRLNLGFIPVLLACSGASVLYYLAVGGTVL